MDNIQIKELISAIENSNSKDWFDYLTAIVSLIVSIVAITLGIRINQKFSLKNQMLQKQLETVYKLIETLQNQRFTIVIRETPDVAGLLCDTSFLEITSLGKERETLFNALSINDPFYYTWDGYDSLEFIKFSKNPYLPRIIADIINQYRYLAYSDPGKMVVEKEDRNVKVYLIPTKKDNSMHIEKPNPWYVEGKYIHTNFATFVEVSKTLNKAIKQWLKKYEVDDLNF
jgi:hypothetical protein